ncbi:MAG: anti-sigma factor [Propionibacteriaceae bacterium]|nr:anti-sigma factor [Propionibacteriaceae bacterium]
MSEAHGAVGSYVVNALDSPELAEFESHLATCETCRREVVEFSETAAHLGGLVETAPPPALRGSILAAIKEVRPLPPELPVAPPEPRPRRAPDESAEAPKTDELALRRQRRATRMLTLAVAAAMVIALALGGWVFNLVQERQAQVAESALETQLLSAPDLKVYTTTLNGAKVSFVVSKSLNKAQFVGYNLPDPGQDKVYQLWTIDQAGPVADSVFAGGTSRKTWFTGDVHQAAALAVTVENQPGAQKPSEVLASAKI